MIVANSRSKYGGKCQAPRHKGPQLIAPGDPIFKVGTGGKTTPQGQGPGFWICQVCVQYHEDN